MSTYFVELWVSKCASDAGKLNLAANRARSHGGGGAVHIFQIALALASVTPLTHAKLE